MSRAVVALGLFLLTGGGGAASPTDWAQPYLTRPIPDAGVVGAGDSWVLLYREIAVEATAAGGFSCTTRQVLAHRGPSPRPLVLRFPYDAVVDQLVDPAVWIVKDRRRKAVKLARSSTDEAILGPGLPVHSRRVLKVTTRPITIDERVIVSWTRITSSVELGEWRHWLLDDLPALEWVAHAGIGVEIIRVQPKRDGTSTLLPGGFRLESLPALERVYPKEGRRLPDPASVLPYVIVRRVDGGPWQWDSIASRVAGWFAGPIDNDEVAALRQIVSEKIPEPFNRLELASRLAAFVQDLRYRGESWGEGAFRPAAPSETLRTGTGDCKGKTRLLMALLAQAGIESVPVLCSSGRRYSDPPPLPSALPFDHVVLAVRVSGGEELPGALTDGPGAGWVLFDPTDRLSPFGQSPPHLEGSSALWLVPEGGGLFRIATRTPAIAEASAALSVTADANGALEFDLDLEGRAALLVSLMESGAARSSQMILTEEIETLLRGTVAGIRVESAQWREPGASPEHHAVGLKIRGRVENSLTPLGRGRSTLAAPVALLRQALGFPEPDPPPREDTTLDPIWRRSECSQPISAATRGEIRIALPEGWRIAPGGSLTSREAPWRIAASSDGATRSFVAALPRGRFDEKTCIQRNEDLSALARILRQPLLVLQPTGPAEQPDLSP